MSKHLTENFDFWFYLSTFGAENTTKSMPFKVENNDQTLPKQLQKNFEKVQKMTFLTPKMAKTRMSVWPKMVDFWTHFRFLSSDIALLGPGKKLKSVSLIAQDI